MNRIQRKSSQPQRNSTSCCRVCLMSDCRLYNIYEYKLADTFTIVSGTVMARDRLPQHLCAYCYVLLLKCSKFRAMCHRTQQLFMWEMNTDSIRRNQVPQRSLNLTPTEVEIVEITPSEANVIYESDEEMLIEALDEDLETEPYMENSETRIDNNFVDLLVVKDALRRKESETQDKVTVIEQSKEHDSDVEYIEDETSDSNFENILSPKDTVSKIKAETPKGKSVTKIGNVSADKSLLNIGKENKSKEKMKMMTIEVKDDKLEFKVDKGSDDNDFFHFEEEVIDDKKVKAKRNTYAEIFRPLRNIFDVEAFERKYNVTTDVLGKEEQLEEIAIRKKSRNYLGSQYQCEECGKGFDLEPTFNNHRVKHTPSSGQHQCEICGVRFKKRCHLTSHGNRHRYKFFCNQCKFVSRTQYQAKSHHAMHTGKTFECPHCGKVYNKSSTCFSHMRIAHPEKNVPCDECGETFVSEKGMRLHKNVAHVVKLQCTICSAVFINSEALDRHRDTTADHADLRPCEQCGENCASEEELQKHVEEAHPPRRCEECNITFSNPAAYETHVQRQHVGKRYTGPNRSGGKKYGYRKRNVPCMCDQCGVTVTNSGMLVYHMRKHRGELPHKCPFCPKAYVARYLLKCHVRTHTGEKPFKCEECPLAFALKANLQRHHQTAHLGIRGSFPCPVCGRTSTTKGSMKVHLRAVHGDGGWPKRNRNKTQIPTTNKTQRQRTIPERQIESDSNPNVRSDSSDSD